jgi:hypothetical protein
VIVFGLNGIFYVSHPEKQRRAVMSIEASQRQKA